MNSDSNINLPITLSKDAPAIPGKHIKKGKKPVSKKEKNPLLNLNNIKSIKIPENFEEKEKLLQSLKNAVAEIDLKIKNLRSKREYYSEISEVLEKEIKERNEKNLIKNREQTNISVIQEELYSKLLFKFYSFI